MQRIKVPDIHLFTGVDMFHKPRALHGLVIQNLVLLLIRANIMLNLSSPCDSTNNAGLIYHLSISVKNDRLTCKQNIHKENSAYHQLVFDFGIYSTNVLANKFGIIYRFIYTKQHSSVLILLWRNEEI